MEELQKSNEIYKQMVVDVCITAAKIMIESGSDIQRVNDTVTRIAFNAGFPDSKAYLTVTGLVFSISSDFGAQVGIVKKRSFDLEKVSVVNELSREFAAGRINLKAFYSRLSAIDKYVTAFPFWMQILGAALVSGPLVFVFEDNISDILVTSLVGMIGWSIFYFLNKFIEIKFLSEFSAALVIGLLALLFAKFGIGTNSDDIIIGSLMPLVPGVPLTNAVRDVLYGNLISGPARAVEALLSATALGFGIAVVIKLF